MNKARLITQLFFSVLIIILIGGCASDNQYQPIIPVDMSPKEGIYRGTATQADRRLILTTIKVGKELPSICAEPFPEGASALETLRKYNLTAREQTTEMEDSLKFATSIPFSVHPAVKFYRDGVFALCQGAMNDWVNTKPGDKECDDTVNELLLKPLLKIEMQSYQSFDIAAAEQVSKSRDTIYNQKPCISEFEYQLNELRKTVGEIFKAEASKAEARKIEAELELEKIRKAKEKD